MKGRAESQSGQNHPATTEARANAEESLGQSGSIQVLSVPELAGVIFSSVNQATLVACALVCRSWKEPALDELSQLLSGGEPQNDYIYPLREVDWTKFRFYARRVRTIDIEPIGLSCSTPIGPFFLRRPPIIGPETPLLPHVRRVKWTTCCSICQL